MKLRFIVAPVNDDNAHHLTRGIAVIARACVVISRYLSYEVVIFRLVGVGSADVEASGGIAGIIGDITEIISASVDVDAAALTDIA